MKRVFIRLALVCVGVCALIMGLRAEEASKENALRSRLVGTWRQIAMKVNGQERNLSDTEITYKHVTPVGFMWLSYKKDTGQVFRSAGGTYTLRDGKYNEKVEYGLGDAIDFLKKSELSFTCKVEGDKWHISGKIADGLTIEEVWERVKPPISEKAK